MKQLNLDLVRATEAAAIAASMYIGSGDKLGADKAATEAMRARMNEMSWNAVVKIGEGIKDQSYGLFAGETLGRYGDLDMAEPYNLAIDPIDGTRPTVTGGPEAMSVIAVSDGPMWTTEAFYMKKLAFGPHIKKKIDLRIDMSLKQIITNVALITHKDINKVMVCMLDRPRHKQYIDEIRMIGARIMLIQDCDISAAIATCNIESGIDVLIGAGGSAESIITAAAMRCLGGGLHAQVCDENCESLEDRYYTEADLVIGPCAFAATGITTGSLLQGVRFTAKGPVTHSVFMRNESSTVRWLTTEHGN